MSKTTTATKATTRPKATFAAASFANLRSVAGEAQGDALRILLADIDEDPDQPRTLFDDADLEAMAASIREFGVVQPITVRPPVNGRYMLAFGARRVRAAKLAGQADIPAVIRNPSPDDYAAQVIENQQRANLSNSDLATAIAKLWEAGKTNKQIAAICSLKDYQVAAFRQADKFPAELQARIDNADMRALYDLFRQWQKTPDEVIAALPDADTFLTVTEARRIIGGITGRPTGSIVLDKRAGEPLDEPTAPVVTIASAPVHEMEAPTAEAQMKELQAAASAAQPMQQVEAPARPAPSVNISAGLAEALSRPAVTPEVAKVAEAPVEVEAPAAIEEPETVAAAEEPKAVTRETHEPLFMVAGRDGQPGQLVTDRRAARRGYAIVAYPTGFEEVEAASLRIVEVN